MLKARAYAKINWILDVGSRRTDGYHDLSTLFQTVSLYDQLWFEPSNSLSLSVEGATLPADASNLVLQAAQALQKLLQRTGSGEELGASIRLEKRIPMAAGLGGGSADAAVTLLALNRLWGAKVDLKTLLTLGAQLGSDVPFFLYGGTAWGSGRGTEITPIADISVPYMLLVNPKVAVSTAQAYRRFDELTNSLGDTILPTCSFSGSKQLFEQVRNSLSQAARDLRPEIAAVEQQLRSFGADPVMVSGSGATVWAVFDSAEKRQEALGLLAESSIAIPVSTVGRDEYLQSVLVAE